LRRIPESTKPESDVPAAEDDEIELIPEGTFAGTRKKPVEVEGGERVAEDTGNQGEGQN
jgi:hypothetical protein